jgi:hypothetical protein
MKKMVNDQDQQAALIDMLREGYVLTVEQVIGLFRVRHVHKYIKQVRDRTGLDIYQGKITIAGGEEDCFYMISDIRPECPGLDHMEEAEPVVDSLETIITNTVETQKGYYLMWICSNLVKRTGDPQEPDEVDVCGQFHKVDLGDEQFTESRSVCCIKCGKRYLVKPIPEN